jgi:hypothetical protein
MGVERDHQHRMRIFPIDDVPDDRGFVSFILIDRSPSCGPTKVTALPPCRWTSVEPLVLPLSDPLTRIDGVVNALTIETDTVREITIVGPGAGQEQAGQGIFADLVYLLRAT